MNAIIDNQLRQTACARVHPVMPAEIAEKLNQPGGIPKIRVPPAPTFKERIEAIAKRLLDLDREVAFLHQEDRAKHEDARTDLEAILFELERDTNSLDQKINGEAREEEWARDAKDWAETECSLRTFGMSVR